MPKPKFIPFADDNSAFTVGGLTLQNGTDSIALFGELAIPNNADFQDQIDQLIHVLQATRGSMGKNLPIPSTLANSSRNLHPNPFK
ncbi:MAG: hypothetical protein RLY95_1144 [Pseudomonadota bacterium]